MDDARPAQFGKFTPTSLFRILGLGPDGKGPASDGQPQSEG